MAEAQKTEAELMAEWENMAAGADVPAESAVAATPVAPERLLAQDEIDSLLGVDSGDEVSKNTGIRALLDKNVVNYEKLPMLEVVYDKFERFLSKSLRQFAADNVDVTIVNITAVRFDDYLNTIPLPAGLVVVNCVGLEDYLLMVYENQLIYAVVDVLLGGRRSTPVRVEGRSFTNIERRIMDNLTDVVLRDLAEAFGPIAPVQFKMERMEVNPRFAVIAQEKTMAILVTVRVNMEGREGQMHFCLPYATLEPIREQLLQQFMGEKFGQDNIWENHLSQELYSTSVALEAVMDEMQFPLSQVLSWRLGDTVVFDATPESPVRIDCAGVKKMVGVMGKARDYKAVRVMKNITDTNREKDNG
ncbi:MAG: flagellar motor switch protein FliM [Alphaproteobacteria bacterium]